MFNELWSLGLAPSFGMQDPRLAELQKALATDYTRQSQVGGQAMVPEDLRTQLISTTFRAKNVPLWQDIAKGKARSTIHEYTTLDSVGADYWGGGWFVAGDLPMTNDPDIARRFAQVFFHGDVREVQHPITLMHIQPGPEGVSGEAEAKHVYSGTLQILRNMERSLMFARNYTNTNAPDGIEIQILGGAGFPTAMAGSDNIIDLRGAYLDDPTLNKAAQTIFDNHGTADHAYLPTTVMSSLSNYLNASRKTELTARAIQEPGSFFHGVQPIGFNSLYGPIKYRPGKLTQISTRQAPTSAMGANAPVAPTDGGITVRAVAGTEVSYWKAADDGNYTYKITAFNPEGESAPLTSGTAAATSTNVVALKIDHSAGLWSKTNKTGVSGYRIYRSEKGNLTGPWYYIDEAPWVDGADDPFVDMNLFLPKTDRVFVSDMSPEDSIDMRLLCPLMKLPLPMTGTTLRFLLLLYSTGPILVAKKKHVLILNAGPYNAG